MGLDRRLRDELHEHAASIEPDTAGRLNAVMQRGGQRGRWSGALAGVAAAVLLIAVAGTMLPLGRQDVALTGTTWTVVLEPGDAGVAELGMAGTWTLRLGERATIELTPPPAFSGGATPEEYIYTVDGTAVTTTLLSRAHGPTCAGPATYTWSIDGDRLTFSGTNSCEVRRVLLETQPWTAAPDASR